jgi:hypothetical protein
MCGTAFVTALTATVAQTSGDCHKSVCDGAGNLTTIVDDNDPPDDNKVCTVDTCSNGAPVHTPKTTGTTCGTGLVCDVTGNCVGCVQGTDCPGADTTCQTRTCTSGMCGFSYATAGTPAGTQTAGDCHKSQCDGSGVIVNAVDDTDLPVDNKECTSDVCTAGAGTNPPVASGTACSQNGGIKCNATGTCVACLQPTDCGVSTPCKTFTCVAGLCGQNNTPVGVVISDPFPGDCKSNQCDGAGNPTVGSTDSADKPVDGNQCTSDVCTGNVPSNPPLASGTACSQAGGTKCNGSGTCVACLQASDCGVNTACKTFSCTAGACSQLNASLGVVAANPTPGDCKTDQCDGAGNIVPNQVDNGDPPADDGNPCTNDVCVGGVPGHPNRADNSACSQGGGTFCHSGACVACVVASDCGTSTACHTLTCVSGQCNTANPPAGTVVANGTVGDCKSDQCDGNGAILTNANDNLDVPADDGNQCTNDSCSAGSPVHPPKTLGATCSQMGGNICDGAGSCVTCTLDSQCPSGGPCQAPKCNAGACGFVAGPALVLPAGSQTAGDCQKLTCDGASQTPVSVADNADLPADDGNACTSDTCVAGAPAHPPTASGTSCSAGGTVCDGAGACVQCVSAATCPGGANACQIATCAGGACGFGPATAGDLPAGSQTPGDCQKLTCNGTTQAVVSVADNADLPADDGNQCTTEACALGIPGHPFALAGTACTQMSGTICDGAGACVGAPTVTGTTPADGGTAAATTTVSVAFSAAMNPATLTGQTALGACTGSIQVSVNDFASCVGFSAAAPVMNGSNTAATFTAQPGLLINRTYKIRVTTAAQSATAVALGAQYTAATGFGTTNPLASASGVVISQVYGGGGNAGSIYKNDFIELHNRGPVAVNVGGWAVQYVSGTGTGTWTVTAIPAGKIIPAGGYFLVQEAAGTGGTTNLPTADVTGTIAMGGTAGKVALTNTTTALTGQCPSGAALVDFVGYGANCSEGSATGTTSTSATNTTSASRNLSACNDSNINNADFTTGAVNPRNTATAAFWCSAAQNESGATGPGEADYCTTQFPLSLSVQTAMVSPTVYGQIYEMGVTEAAGANATVTAQLGYGPITANPEYESGWSWNATTYNVQSGGNDEYQATFTAPAVGTYRYGYRFSFDAGVTWTYCDNNQGDAGAGANGANTLSLAFDLENLGVLTVTP